jgi:hypothetical protein
MSCDWGAIAQAFTSAVIMMVKERLACKPPCFGSSLAGEVETLAGTQASEVGEARNLGVNFRK